MRKYNIEDDTWQEVKAWHLVATAIASMGLLAMCILGIYSFFYWIVGLGS